MTRIDRGSHKTGLEYLLVKQLNQVGVQIEVAIMEVNKPTYKFLQRLLV